MRAFILLLMICNFMLLWTPCLSAASEQVQKSNHEQRDDTNKTAIQDDGKAYKNPVLAIKPREIDFGIISPGEGARGSFSMKNIGMGVLRWSATGPVGWQSLDMQRLSGHMEIHQEELNLHLSILDINLPGGSVEKLPMKVQLIIESVDRRVVYQKGFVAGSYRESISVQSNGGTRTIFFRFRVAEGASLPVIHVEPVKIDFGELNAGERTTKRIELQNIGSDALKWNLWLERATESASVSYSKKGRYISFFNENIKGKDVYETVGHLKEKIEINGSWSENGGYPEIGPNGTLKFHFSGSGVAVLFWKNSGGGKLKAFINDKLMYEIDCFSEKRERFEAIIAEGLMDMKYTLTLVNAGSRTAIEGVLLYGRDVKTGVQGMVNVFPTSGVTMKEKDYINISVNSENLTPGWYGEDIYIKSTGGDVKVELSFEVSPDDSPKILDVYRYAKGNEVIYTSDLLGEAKRLEMVGYRKDGIAFRLFKAGTPGTVSFYRWYNPKKKDYFYSYDISGGGKPLSGYVFEGIIGNIATSQLTNTRGLYRWYNPANGVHFYTTDQRGEGQAKRGYHFESIAGYVR